MISRFRKQKQIPKMPRPELPSALDMLVAGAPFNKNEEERADMTISCKDAEDIPNVKRAGAFDTVDGTEVQIMHNGLKVKRGGYYGDWMARIIRELKGHHEPQEEKIFYELLRHVKSGGTMIELGAFWSYYSLWFNKSIKN